MKRKYKFKKRVSEVTKEDLPMMYADEELIEGRKWFKIVKVFREDGNFWAITADGIKFVIPKNAFLYKF